MRFSAVTKYLGNRDLAACYTVHIRKQAIGMSVYFCVNEVCGHHVGVAVYIHCTNWHQIFVYVSVFQTRDAFVGYRDDTPAAVVFQANRQLQSLSRNTNFKSSEWVRYHSIGIFTGNLTPAALLSQDEDAWNEAVRISRTCVKICSNCFFFILGAETQSIFSTLYCITCCNCTAAQLRSERWVQVPLWTLQRSTSHLY